MRWLLHNRCSAISACRPFPADLTCRRHLPTLMEPPPRESIHPLLTPCRFSSCMTAHQDGWMELSLHRDMIRRLNDTHLIWDDIVDDLGIISICVSFSYNFTFFGTCVQCFFASMNSFMTSISNNSLKCVITGMLTDVLFSSCIINGHLAILIRYVCPVHALNCVQ